MIATQASLASSTAPFVSCIGSCKLLPVYFVMDFSNISIGASGLAKRFDLPSASANTTRIHCGNFRAFVERDRDWMYGFAAGGFKSPQPRLVKRYKEVGIVLKEFEPGRRTGTEQGVDEALQVALYRLVDRPVGVVALATGDGNGHENGEGFLPALRRLYNAGFTIEVMSWRHCLNQELRRWTESHGTVIELDNWFHQLTFDEGRRSVMKLGDVAGKLRRQLASGR